MWNILSEKDRTIFKLLRNRFLVFTSFYASQFRLEFISNFDLRRRVGFENKAIAVEVGAEIKKESNAILVSKILSPLPLVVTESVKEVQLFSI